MSVFLGSVQHCRNVVLFSLQKGACMKKLMMRFAVLIMIFSMLTPVNVFADGDGNIDSGGSGMGQGTSNNVWSPGNEGVRVTVVRSSDHAIVTTPIDFTNKPPSSTIYNFGKVSKIQYNNGRALSPVKGGYACVKPSQSMPKIISTNGSNNIDEIKKYFCSEYLIKLVSNQTGMSYDLLINGDYKLLLEPMAYYKFEGVMIATTATEAAMYDEAVNGLLRRRMVSLTHKNLPLAMFLEVSDLGYPAWSGSRTTAASDSDIKSSLGLGIVRFKEQPEEVVVCSPHRTRESIFSDLILNDIREKAQLITLDENAIIAEIKRKKQADTTSEQKAVEKKLQTLRHRLSELERLISKLYEEMVLEDIPREMVLDMMEKYKKEQQEKSILAAQLAEQLTHSQEVDNDIHEWVSLIRNSMGIDKLDRELLIKLVDKIVVGQKTVVDGVERQEITIIYSLVGQVD